MRSLLVYMNNERAGVLTEHLSGKRYTFSYYSDYLNTNYPPISVTMPKRKQEYESETLFPFFANIIPEGANRGVICRTLRIDEHDCFGILSAMAGKEFIGAVRIDKM